MYSKCSKKLQVKYHIENIIGHSKIVKDPPKIIINLFGISEILLPCNHNLRINKGKALFTDVKATNYGL